MNNDDIKNNLLNRFLRNATIEEMEELYRLLDEKEKRDKKIPGLNGKLDLESMAKNMPRQIQEQLGTANLNIKKMARDLVVQLALQHKPDISEKELNAIVNQMVPDSKRSSIADKLPPDLLMTMVLQFVETDINTGLEWKKRYWEVFPDEIKSGIAGFLSGDIGKVELFRITAAFGSPEKQEKRERKKKGMPVPPTSKKRV